MGDGWHKQGAPNSAQEVLEGLLAQMLARVLHGVPSGVMGVPGEPEPTVPWFSWINSQGHFLGLSKAKVNVFIVQLYLTL